MKTLKQLRKIQEAGADDYVVDPDDDEEALEYQPRSDGEIEFVDLHSVEVSNHPAAPEDQHVAKTSHNKHKGAEHPGEPVVKQGTSGDVKFSKFREKITKTPLRKGDKSQGDMKAVSVKEEVDLDEGKSGTGYDLYHKDFSSAMKHAYDFAKRKYGITISNDEIDDKVATGPRKPSEGKTNSYRLKGDKGAIQVQVYNKGGSKPFELNMYKEEVNEAKMNPYVSSDRDGKHVMTGSGKIAKTFKDMDSANQYLKKHYDKLMKEDVEFIEEAEQVVTLPKGVGFYDTTKYPIGGKFDRVTNSNGLKVTVKRRFKLYKGTDTEGMTSDGKKVAFQMRLAKEEVELGEKVQFEAPTKDKKGTFQVIDRDTKGMPGSQDKFKMQSVDKRGKVIKDWGSHPSLDGAKKFAKNKGIIEEVEFIEEAVKAGTIKLENGKSVKVTKEDADAFNAVLKELNPENRKRMESEMMKDEKSYKNMLTFAKRTM